MTTRIVIPCYDEEKRLPVASFDEYLAANTHVEFVLVNDGSRDGTLPLLHSMATRWPGRIIVIDQQPNQGKAEAVRRGMSAPLSEGIKFAGYWDADLATPLSSIEEFARVLTERPGIDLVLGARVALLGRNIDRAPMRHYLGRIFATAASLALDLPVYDTQCGAKLLRASPHNLGLFAKPFMSRWIFDVELIARYLCSGGRAEGLYELPLSSWRDVGASKVRTVDFLRSIGELFSIHRAYRRRRE